MSDNNQVAKISGSALLEEMAKQTALLQELNTNILALIRSNQVIHHAPSTAPLRNNVSLKDQVARHIQKQQPVTPQPQMQPQHMQQAAAMYPSMSGTTQPHQIVNGERVSGIEEPAWMNHLTPIDKSKI